MFVHASVLKGLVHVCIIEVWNCELHMSHSLQRQKILTLITFCCSRRHKSSDVSCPLAHPGLRLCQLFVLRYHNLFLCCSSVFYWTPFNCKLLTVSLLFLV